MGSSEDAPHLPWLHGYRPDGTPLPAGTTLEALLAIAEEFGKDRTVAIDRMTVDERQVTVSTVFLVWDASLERAEHVPEVYETAIIVDGNFSIYGRCSTRAEAEALHAEALNMAHIV